MRWKMALSTLSAAGLAMCWSAPAKAEPALSLHFGPTGYPACTAIVPDTLSCAEIVVEGDPSSTQRIYVVISGVDSLRAVEFGVSRGTDVEILYWQACQAPMAIPQPAWPDSGTGIALSWGNGLVTAGPDSMAILGFMEIDAGSNGVVRITADPRTDRVAYGDASGATHVIPAGALGAADTGGHGGGIRACAGAAESAGGVLGSDGTSGPVSPESPMAIEIEEITSLNRVDASFSGSLNVVDCDPFPGSSGDTAWWLTLPNVTGNDDDDHTRVSALVPTLGEPSVVGFQLAERDFPQETRHRHGLTRILNQGFLDEQHFWQGVDDPWLALPRSFGSLPSDRGGFPQRRLMEPAEGSSDIILAIEERDDPSVERMGGDRIRIRRVVGDDYADTPLWDTTYDGAFGPLEFLAGVEVDGDAVFVSGYTLLHPSQTVYERRTWVLRLNATTGAVEDTLELAPFPIDFGAKDLAIDSDRRVPWVLGDTECPDESIEPCAPSEGELYILRVDADALGDASLEFFNPPDLDLFAETIDVTPGGTVSVGCRSRSAEDEPPGRLSALTRRDHGTTFNLTRFVGDIFGTLDIYPTFNGAAAVDGISYVLGTTGVPGSAPVASVVFAVNSRNGDGLWATALTCPSGVLGGDVIVGPDAHPLVAVTSDLPGWSLCSGICMVVLKLDVATGAVRYTRFVPNPDADARLATTLTVQETDPDIGSYMRVFVLGDAESDGSLHSSWGVNAGAVRLPRDELVAADEEPAPTASTVSVQKSGQTLVISLSPSAGMRAQLFDVTGRRVADGRTLGSELHLALPTVSGAYFLRVAHENQVVTRRVTVVR